ncbi:MAG: response regulator [Anaerolineales bacterium]|nr:response regulator [Anaerolineales bacterium]
MIKILIAEDERDIRDLIAFTLRYHGYHVVVAADGEQALDLTFKELPDLVMLDVRMPRMSGYEVCQRIKNDEKLQHIPVVFFSAKGQEAEVKEGLEAGAIDYILKPFSPDHLVDRVMELVGK